MKTKKNFLLIILLSINIYAQKKTFKCEKVYDAVKLIDEQKYNEAIKILEECENLDPSDYTYPYEIALAKSYSKDYDGAIKKLIKIKDYTEIKDDYYQLLGNNYDYAGDSVMAIKTYDEGLKKFPKSGRLYLEKGVMYESSKPIEALKIYEKGIEVDPMYPSNYYRVAKIYLKTNDRLSGLIYGEIFMNLERTTSRTQEMSKLLYEGYKNSLIFVSQNQKKTEFCPAIFDAEKYEKNEVLPLCMNFAYSFVVAMMDYNDFTYENFIQMRKNFLKEYQNEKTKNAPNVLLNYFKTMDENKVFNAYNYYIFQIANKKAFAEWQTINKDEYDSFVEWYTNSGNELKIDSKNVLISDQIK